MRCGVPADDAGGRLDQAAAAAAQTCATPSIDSRSRSGEGVSVGSSAGVPLATTQPDDLVERRNRAIVRSGSSSIPTATRVRHGPGDHARPFLAEEILRDCFVKTYASGLYAPRRPAAIFSA
jgi:hypothetical protein